MGLRASMWAIRCGPVWWNHTGNDDDLPALEDAGYRIANWANGNRQSGALEIVNIGKFHSAFMTFSKSLERFRLIPGRTPPVALETGNLTRVRQPVFVFARRSVRPSSTKDTRKRPSSAARFLARFSRSSFILMVVLMHQYITLMHQ